MQSYKLIAGFSQQNSRLISSGSRKITPIKSLNKKLYSTEKNVWPPKHLQKKYDHFQMDNGVPVYLKGGVGDRILVGTTLILMGVGLFDGLSMLLRMAFPKKPK